MIISIADSLQLKGSSSTSQGIALGGKLPLKW